MKESKNPTWPQELCRWYRYEARDLPWRRDKDPYKIWLSEIMLQQTQVVTVVDYFNKFIYRFPTVEALAEASEDDIMTMWQGLGYYQRARNMHRCAKEVVKTYKGNFPTTVVDLLKLPGVGPYTAGAIASIAFDEKVPAVDGNVMRVLARLYELTYDLSQSKSIAEFQNFLKPLIPDCPSDFTQAMMDLGATICTPKQAHCSQCPIKNACKGFEKATLYQYPVKTKKVKKKQVEVTMAVVKSENRLLFYKQTSDRLLNGMWLLPHYQEALSVDSLRERLKEDYALGDVIGGVYIGKVRHVFTHLVWDIGVYVFEVESQALIDYPIVIWQDVSELDQIALPKMIKKAMDLCEMSGVD